MLRIEVWTGVKRSNKIGISALEKDRRTESKHASPRMEGQDFEVRELPVLPRIGAVVEQHGDDSNQRADRAGYFRVGWCSLTKPVSSHKRPPLDLLQLLHSPASLRFKLESRLQTRWFEGSTRTAIC
jgi:hypothetical protein